MDAGNSPSERIYRIGCRAMNARFEIALWGGDAIHLRAAAEEALREVGLLEQQLSFYRDDSDIRTINTRAAYEPVPVDGRLFSLLQRAKQLSQETSGAFDITIAPLLGAWGFTGEGGRTPSNEEIDAARAITGMHLLELDFENLTVRFLAEGVTIDLGAIGKGYAVEQAAEILRDAEVGGALIHGGTSSVQAVGGQTDGTPWQVAIQDPLDAANHLAVVPLVDRSLSVSAVHGKFFTEGEARFGHVLDPRTGRPVQGALLAAVVCDSATDGDALSTALLTLGSPFLPELCDLRPNLGALVAVADDDGGLMVASSGIL